MPRKDDIQMNPDEIRSYLGSGHTMTLTTNGPRGFPHAVAMFFVIDDDLTIRFATYASSQKIKNIERDPKVALLVETGRAYRELKGVMIEGRAQLTTEPPAACQRNDVCGDGTLQDLFEACDDGAGNSDSTTGWRRAPRD